VRGRKGEEIYEGKEGIIELTSQTYGHYKYNASIANNTCLIKTIDNFHKSLIINLLINYSLIKIFINNIISMKF